MKRDLTQKSMVKPERLQEFLPPDFQRREKRHGGLCFSRKSQSHDLFEQFWIGASGKKGEAAWVTAVVSVLQGPDGFEGLLFEELLFDLASDRERRMYYFKNAKDVAAWEQRVANSAQERARSLAANRGSTLLAATESLRELAAKYTNSLRQTNDEKNQDYLEYQLTKIATPEQVRHATRLAESASGSCYMTAALTLVLFSESIEGDGQRYFHRSVHDHLKLLDRAEDPKSSNPEFQALAQSNFELWKLLAILSDRVRATGESNG